eukprot:355668-Chlamydomonas_euryale.AAC.10
MQHLGRGRGSWVWHMRGEGRGFGIGGGCHRCSIRCPNAATGVVRGGEMSTGRAAAVAAEHANTAA